MSGGIFTRLGAMVAVGLVLVGCDSIQGNQSPVFTAAEENAAARNITTSKVVEEYFQKDAVKRQDFRDEIITRRMNAINTNYRVFITELREARAGTGLLADGTTTVLALLTAVIGGAGTKAALGAGTAAVGSAKGAFDKNVFYEKALAAVIAQMDTQRAIVTKEIRQGMKEPITNYPLISALDDLARLERAGSIESAIAGLTSAAERTARIEESKIQENTITRPAALAEYLVSPEGRKRAADFDAAMKKLSTDKIFTLAFTPPVRNTLADELVKSNYGSVDVSKLSDADRKGISQDIVSRRYTASQSLEEMAAWEKAIK